MGGRKKAFSIPVVMETNGGSRLEEWGMREGGGGFPPSNPILPALPCTQHTHAWSKKIKGFHHNPLLLCFFYQQRDTEPPCIRQG